MNSNYKDPLNYIFKIIKYIIKRDTSPCKDYVIKAFGKCVGSKLRGEKYDEIKLLVPKMITNELIDILSITDVISSIDNSTNNYELLILNLNNSIIKYRIYTHPIFFVKHLNISDIYFTCDNLAMTFNGNIHTIVPSAYETYDECDWITQCINDTISKKFSIIPLMDKQNISLLIDVNQQYNEIIKQGFTYVANINDIIFKNHKDIKVYCERDISVSCSICREDYCGHKLSDTVLLKCLHDFHIDCVHSWIKINNNKCPLCRVDIDFKPQTKYGDSVIDNIIENYQA